MFLFHFVIRIWLCFVNCASSFCSFWNNCLIWNILYQLKLQRFIGFLKLWTNSNLLIAIINISRPCRLFYLKLLQNCEKNVFFFILFLKLLCKISHWKAFRLVQFEFKHQEPFWQFIWNFYRIVRNSSFVQLLKLVEKMFVKFIFKRQISERKFVNQI